MTEPGEPPMETAETSFDDAAQNAAMQFRRRKYWAMTPEERLHRSAELSRLAFETLESNPVALAAFVARNHRKRSQANKDRLEKEMRREQDHRFSELSPNSDKDQIT